MNWFTAYLMNYTLMNPTSPLAVELQMAAPERLDEVLRKQEYQDILASFPKGKLSVNPKIFAKILEAQKAIRDSSSG